MSNEKFKVKFGLAVGDTSMTVDAATGNTETNGIGVFKQNTTGSVTLGDGSGNGSIEIGQSNRATSGTPFIDWHSSATNTDYDVRMLVSDGSATAGSGKLTITSDEVRLTNSLTLLGSSSGGSTFTAPATGSGLAYTLPGSSGAANTVLTNDGTGVLSWALPGGGGSTFGNISIGVVTDNTIASTDTNGDIIIQPNGTGDVSVVADTLFIGDGGANAAITTNGTGNLYLNTNNSVNSGQIYITAGVDGAIVADPNGTGYFQVTKNLIVDLDIDVKGGDITNSTGTLGLNSSSGTITMKSNGTLGITLDPITGFNPNTDFTGNIVKGTIRDSVTKANGDIWNTTGPGAQTSGISIDNTDKVATRSGLVLRNYGASLSGGLPRNTITGEVARGTAATPLNLNSNQSLIDIVGNGYTSTGWATDLVSTVPGLMRLTTTEAWNNGANNVGTGFVVLAQPTATTLTTGGSSLVSVISANPQTHAYRGDQYLWSRGKAGTTNMAQLFIDGSNKVTYSINQPRATSGSEFAVMNFSTFRSTDGINYTPTQINDTLGSFKFNGNANTSTSPGVAAGPGCQITAKATENWTPTANGTKVDFFTIKTGTTTDFAFMSGSSDYLDLASNITNLNTTQFTTTNPTTSSSYNSSSNAQITPGNPAGAGFNDRISQLRLQTASTSVGEASTVTFNTGNYNTGTKNFSASVAGDTLGEFFFSGNYGTGNNFTTLGPSVRFAGRAAETFTNTNSGGRFVVSVDKIGGNVSYDIITADSLNTNIASNTITLESNSGTDYAVLNATSATFTQPVGFPVRTAATWNSITGVVGQQVCVSDSGGGGNPNGMMAFWDTTNNRWSYIHDNSAV